MISKNEYIYGLHKQEVAQGLNRPIGVVLMLLTESIGEASDAGIGWKETVFFYAEASSMETARNSCLFME